MSTTLQIHCDVGECPNHFPMTLYKDTDSITIPKIIVAAINHGWVVDEDGIVYCTGHRLVLDNRNGVKDARFH